MELDKYVGRIVCLKDQVFAQVARKASRRGRELENRFVVAAVSQELHKLICYGSNFRIAVSESEVVLV